MSPRTCQKSFSIRTFGAALAPTTLALLAATAPAAHAQNDFDTDGEIIGQVSGDADVGAVNTNPFTVYTDAATHTDLSVYTYNQSTLDVNGGFIGGNLYVSDSSAVNMRGGAVDGGVYAIGGTFTMSGGLVGNRSVVSSQFYWQDDIFCYGNAVVNITGGTFLGGLVAEDSGVLSVFGTGLSKTLLTSDFFFGNDVGYRFSEYALSGFLQDGTDISGKIAYVGSDNGTFNLVNAAAVPEPGLLVFGVILAGSVLGLLTRKRRA